MPGRRERRHEERESVVYNQPATEVYERSRIDHENTGHGTPAGGRYRRDDGGSSVVSEMARRERFGREQDSDEIIVEIEEDDPPRERLRRKDRDQDRERDRDSGLGSDHGKRSIK